MAIKKVKIVLEILVEESDVKFIIPSIEDGMGFGYDEGIITSEIKEIKEIKE